jgi:hypothetical protein
MSHEATGVSRRGGPTDCALQQAKGRLSRLWRRFFSQRPAQTAPVQQGCSRYRSDGTTVIYVDQMRSLFPDIRKGFRNGS